jgi:hypothetical protein
VLIRALTLAHHVAEEFNRRLPLQGTLAASSALTSEFDMTKLRGPETSRLT